MNEHLKILASKGYKDAVIEDYKKSGRGEKIGYVFTIMFIQSDSYIDKLHKIDPSFRDSCTKHDILLSAPTGLAGLLSLSRYEIAKEKQEQNYETIISELSTFMGHVEIVLGHAAKVGKGIESAANNYEKFVSSVNTRLLPKARNIEKMGVSLPKNKGLPSNLASYHVITETKTIEGESAEISKIKKLEEAS